ncbi:Metallo-beta-lactamase superfamily protein [Mycena venus]|uniref:Metallo-beta-lactamase superfamily protein n=1 Tax=Mycena venus TaxID=2733690 RepID=A0A8H6YU72_9AGAR|nr:Metallo-beta-lactamase superfamily protein [Mycena venus]
MSFLELGIPVSNGTVSLKVFNVAPDMRTFSLPSGAVMHPVLPGHEAFRAPIFASLIEHAASGRRVMFDLGVRRDLENAAPRIVQLIKDAGTVLLDRDISELLIDDGVDLGSINAVIWSHAHFDHIGDMSKFPSSTQLVFGQSTVLESHEVNPNSTLLESVFRSVSLCFEFLKFIDFWVAAGSWSPSTSRNPRSKSGFQGTRLFRRWKSLCTRRSGSPRWLRLRPRAGDADQLRLPRWQRLPPRSLCGALPAPLMPLDSSIWLRMTPMLNVSEEDIYEDKPTARSSIAKMEDFDANEDVFVVLTHDQSLVEAVGPFPVALDDWQAKGWKSRVTWAFLDEANSAFRFNVGAASP